jgi:pentafunctional AROM polypeptide
MKNIYLFNRTKSRAEEIARDFANLFQVTLLDRLENLSNEKLVAPDVLIGTIPAEHTTPRPYSPSHKGSALICLTSRYKRH